MPRMIFYLAPFGAIGLGAGSLWGADIAGAMLTDPGEHGAWYASRAAGIAAYVCVWAGLAGGLGMSSAWLDGYISRARLLAIHQTATFMGIALGFAHAFVLIPDGWTTFGLGDVLVPFGSYYERVDVGVGSLSLYLSAIVAGSFWLRRRIGMRAWRYLHYSSFLAWAGALWHGLRVGTDSGEAWVLAIYAVTALIVVFALMVRLTYVRERPQRAPTGAKVA